MARATFDAPALRNLGLAGGQALLATVGPVGLAAMQAATPVRTGVLRDSERWTPTFGASGPGIALYADADDAIFVNNGARGRPGVHFMETGLDAAAAALRGGGR